ANREPAGVVALVGSSGGQGDVQRRADPSCRMDVVRMFSPATQPNRPAAGEAHQPVARAAKQWVLWIDRRQIAHVIFDCSHRRRTDLPDQRIDATEQWSVGLRTTAYRLVEIFAPAAVQGPEALGQSV